MPATKTRKARPKRTIPRGELERLAAAMGGRQAIADALGNSRPAVDRYFVGKGMPRQVHEALTALLDRYLGNGQPPEDLVPEPPTLEEQGGHLYRLLVKAVERDYGVDVVQATLNRMEIRLQRIETNQQALLRAWQMDPARTL